MREDDKISILEKRFIGPILSCSSLFFFVLRYALGGIIYATASFFTFNLWERWKSRSKD